MFIKVPGEPTGKEKLKIFLMIIGVLSPFICFVVFGIFLFEYTTVMRDLTETRHSLPRPTVGSDFNKFMKELDAYRNSSYEVVTKKATIWNTDWVAGPLITTIVSAVLSSIFGFTQINELKTSKNVFKKISIVIYMLGGLMLISFLFLAFANRANKSNILSKKEFGDNITVASDAEWQRRQDELERLALAQKIQKAKAELESLNKKGGNND